MTITLDGKKFWSYEGTTKHSEKRLVIAETVKKVIRNVFKSDRKIGVITSGTFLSWINAGAAMAYLDPAEAVVGNHAEVDVRGRRVPVEVVELPFYSRTRKK